jgi:antibiotic biosynthesis monooxygenase (ABM) superfamily enzyme
VDGMAKSCTTRQSRTFWKMTVNLWELFFSVTLLYRTVFGVVMQILPTSTLKIILHTLIHTFAIENRPQYLGLPHSEFGQRPVEGEAPASAFFGATVD